MVQIAKKLRKVILIRRNLNTHEKIGKILKNILQKL